jgi:hypothetical protein
MQFANFALTPLAGIFAIMKMTTGRLTMVMLEIPFYNTARSPRA